LRAYRIITIVLWGLVFRAQLQFVRALAQEQCSLAVGVLNSATHTGLPHAMVSYTGTESGYRFTDSGGNVSVENVPCGSYTLSVSKSGFVSSAQATSLDVLLDPARLDEFNGELGEPAERGFTPVHKTVHLTQASRSIRIALLPVSSIGGVVLNENGEPLNGVSIQAIAAQTSLASINYVLARTVRTDASGHYMLAGLIPGDYVVRLAGKAFAKDLSLETAANRAESRRGIPLVYYSGVDTLAAATILHVAPGEHASADFQPAMQPAVNIDGRLTGFVPGDQIKIELYPENDKIPAGNIFVDTSTGLFHALDVPAGTYTLRVLQYQTTRSQWLTAEVPLLVKSKPLHDLIIPLSPGMNLPISVSYEAGAESGEPVQLVLQPQHARIKRQLVVGGSAHPLSDAKSRFQLTNVVPDLYRLYVTLPDRSKSYVTSATLGNADALHREFRLPASAEGELHVTIRGDSASVAGRVVLQEQPAAGAQIYLIPSESPEWVKVGVADERGQFRIQGISPGNFQIRAWMGAPSVTDLLSARGELLILQPSENKTVMLEAQSNLEQEDQ
jgi:protocatechuate 3,4-dioxygenase beta subunit